ncbi:MAG: L-histidine N(alpha)-methyltransferase [Spirochaetales bacterium]|nr:L-histidine N(alpha)-methyltransferase [Spirochaetales bacterium]
MSADLDASIRRGLGQKPRSLPSILFYDAEGSRLFEEITRLPEYYLTRAEISILQRATEITGAIQSAGQRNGPSLVFELGAGNGEKAALLLKSFAGNGWRPEFHALDVSALALSALQKRFQSMDLAPAFLHEVSFEQAAQVIGSLRRGPALVLFLGSNIGNFDPVAAESFFHSLSALLSAGDLFLLGYDLKKDPAILLPAYADRAGVTREFNLNMLRHLNREWQANFPLDSFYHHALYHPPSGAMESHLIATRELRIRIERLQMEFTLGAHESIHTESSYKYTIEQMISLAGKAGLLSQASFLDEEKYFCDQLFIKGSRVSL